MKKGKILKNGICVPFMTVMLIAVSMALPFISRAANITVSRDYDVSSIEVKTEYAPDGTVFQRINWDGLCSDENPGFPELPVDYVNFIVPEYSGNFNASAVSVRDGVNIPLTSKILPVQYAQKTDGSICEDFLYPDKSTYSSPYNVDAWVVDEGFIDGCNHIVTVAVRPVTYDPVSMGVTAYKKMDIRLEYEACSPHEICNSKPITPPSPSRFIKIGEIVDNPSSLKQFAPRVYSSRENEKYPDWYYIIVPENLEAAVSDLVVWKSQKGYNVVVKTIEEILSDRNYKVGVADECVDEAASLRCYLRDEYEVHGAYFCLLVGNSKTSMPIRKAARDEKYNFYKESYSDKTNGDFFTPTDFYFSDLTSSFDLSLMGSDPTLYSFNYSSASNISRSVSIYVGRLLASTEYEIKNYIDKLILYESNPGRGNDAYLGQAFFFEQYKESASLIGDSRQVRDVSDKITPSTLFPVEVDDSIRSGTYPKGRDVIDMMKGYGLLSIHAHGNPLGFATAANPGYGAGDDYYVTSVEGVPGYDDHPGGITDSAIVYEESNGLDNLDNANEPCVIYSVSCTLEPFDLMHPDMEWPNVAESFTNGYRYGGPVFLGNTRAGALGPSGDLERCFFQSLAQSYKVGVAESISKMKYSGFWRNHLVLTHNLVGDPEMELWKGKPLRFENVKTDIDHRRVIISGDGLDGADISYYIYGGTPASNTIAGNETAFDMDNSVMDFTVSVWKTGYLPIVNLYCLDGKMENVSRKYIVQRAFLGGSDPEPGNSKKSVIGNGATFSVKASNSVVATSDFVIDGGADVIIECDKTVALSCLVKKGGRLTVRSNDVRLGVDFQLEQGGELILQDM